MNRKLMKELGLELTTNIKSTLSFQLSGLDKTGKTNFLLSFPSPLLFLNFDKPKEYNNAWKVAEATKEIIHKKFMPISLIRQEGQTKDALKEKTKIANRAVVDHMYRVIKSAPELGIKSIVADGVSQFHDVFIPLMLLGTPKVPQVLYGDIRREFEIFVNLLYNTGCHFGLTSRLKAEYVNKEPTGNLIPAGYYQIKHVAQTNIRLSKAIMKDDGKKHFYADIENSSTNPALDGEPYIDYEINFQYLAMQLSPDVNPQEWL